MNIKKKVTDLIKALGLKPIVNAFGFAWIYRTPINAVVEDADALRGIPERLAAAEDVKAAQKVVQEILKMDSVCEIIKATETKWDDKQIERLRALVSHDAIFEAAWKLIHGDWSINVVPNRLQKFVQRVKKVLPFARPDMDVLKQSAKQAVTLVEDEQVEFGVIEVISLLRLLWDVMPVIIEVIKYFKKPVE